MELERNPYKNDIDFLALAVHDEEFAKILKPNNQLDFSDPEAVQQLSKTLLKRDFDLSVKFAPDRLCPPVPNRLNYVLWLQDLLDTTSSSFSEKYDPEREVIGLDSGTGSSCIYPLLGCRQRENWRFIGTDSDVSSLDYARDNVTSNGLQDRVELFLTQPTDALIPMELMKKNYSEADLIESASLKARPPFTACTGSASEMVTPGGEVAFVSRMIDESLVHQQRVQWYSSMLGKHSSVTVIVQKLRLCGIDNYAVTEFVQGSRTRRWAVAWSCKDMRPVASANRGLTSLPKGMLPFPTDYLFSISKEASRVGIMINEIMTPLSLKWEWDPAALTGFGFTTQNVWSRASRRQRKRSNEKIDEHEDEEKNDESEISLGLKIIVSRVVEKKENVKITVRWLQGHDQVLFESFCGMLKRKLTD